jgi:hypothetical protein
MCCEPGARLRTILHFLETRVPKIILQRVEELYPGVVESMVSVLFAENDLLILFCMYLCGHRK